MRKPPCKDCPDRHLACHDKCEKYKEWKDYLTETKTKEKLDHRSYRSKATDNKAMKDKKKNSASYMRNKF